MERKVKKRVWIIAAVILLLVFLHWLNVTSSLENKIISGFLNTQASIYNFFNKLNYSFINYQQAQTILKENEQLKTQLDDLIRQNALLKDLELENNNLKALLNYFENQNFQYQIGRVIAKDVDRPNTIVINQGSLNGLKIGQPVIVGNGVFIGKIIDVKESLATVLLLTDPALEVAVTLPSYDHSIGIARGEYGLSLKVELIPQNEVVNENDTLITSGLEGDIPRGLVLGQVNRIVSTENDLFKTATVKTLINYKNISLVGVIK